MKIYIGEKGLNKSWQLSFDETIKCHNCETEAKIMFSGMENYPRDKGNFICDLHETTGKKGGLWLHDACAIAVYLCPKCFEVTSKLNQG